MDTMTVELVSPVSGRHVPFTLDGEIVFQDNYVLVTDNIDGMCYVCEATPQNLTLLNIALNVEGSNNNLLSGDSSVPEKEASSVPISAEPPSPSTQPKQPQCSGVKWSDDARRFLICLWKEKGEKFASPLIRNAEVWKEIAEELRENGLGAFSGKQVEDKWKNIRKKYMQVKDNGGAQQSGQPRITCKFYEELEDVLGKSPSVKPLSIASSSQSNKILCRDSPSIEETDSEADEGPKAKKKKVPKLQRDSLAWLSKLRADAEKREELKKERHTETMQMLDNVMKSYGAQMQKLIDKL